MVGQFRYSVWDPILIISQMIAIQSIYYVSLGLWLSLMDLLNGSTQSLDQIFSYKEIQVKDLYGRMVIAAFLINALTCAVGLWYIVQRTKQCLDFTATVHLIHLIICWIYLGEFPITLAWWLVTLICVTVMCVGGEFLCMRTELKAIPVSFGPKADL